VLAGGGRLRAPVAVAPTQMVTRVSVTVGATLIITGWPEAGSCSVMYHAAATVNIGLPAHRDHGVATP